MSTLSLLLTQHAPVLPSELSSSLQLPVETHRRAAAAVSHSARFDEKARGCQNSVAGADQPVMYYRARDVDSSLPDAPSSPKSRPWDCTKVSAPS